MEHPNTSASGLDASSTTSGKTTSSVEPAAAGGISTGCSSGGGPAPVSFIVLRPCFGAAFTLFTVVCSLFLSLLTQISVGAPGAYFVHSSPMSGAEGRHHAGSLAGATVHLSGSAGGQSLDSFRRSHPSRYCPVLSKRQGSPVTYLIVFLYSLKCFSDNALRASCFIGYGPSFSNITYGMKSVGGCANVVDDHHCLQHITTSQGLGS